jgi:hypothetical protein
MSLADILEQDAKESWKKISVVGLQMTGGEPLSGQVLTSDSKGNGSWQTASPTPVQNSQSWAITGNFTSPVSDNTIVFNKIGNMVTVAVPTVEAHQAGAGTVTYGPVSLPAQFRPSTSYDNGFSSGNLYFQVQGTDNSTNKTLSLLFSYSDLSSVEFSLTPPTLGNFSGTGLLIQNAFSFSYFTD